MRAATMRPTFTVELPHPPDEVMARLRARIEADDTGRTQSKGRHAEFFVPEAERRLWSPHLSIQVYEEGNGAKLHARFSPRPEVWTFVMFVYFLMGFVALFGASFGYVQTISDESAWGFWGVPLGMAVIALLHGASLLGQRLSSDQMNELRTRITRVLEEEFGRDVLE